MKKTLVTMLAGLSVATYAPALLAKSTVGGIVFLNTYSQSIEKGYLNSTDADRFKVDVPGNTRLRVKWTNEDRISMYTELGLGSKVSLRHAWGKWDFSETWQVMAGHTSTPFAPLNPNVAMVHNSGQGVGSVSPSRQAQLRFTYKFLNRQGALAVALVDPNNGATLTDKVAAGNLGTKETSLPRIDIGMAYRTANWQIFPSVFYQTQDYSSLTTAGSDNSVDSWGASLGFKTAFGPLTVTAEVGSGQNWGNTKMSLSGSAAGDNAAAVTYASGGITKIADMDNTGYWIDLGYRFTTTNTKGAVHLIYGSLTSESSASVASANNDIESTMLGLSIPIDMPWIARGFRVRPELFVFDYGNNTIAGTAVESGQQTIAGVQLQYTF